MPSASGPPPATNSAGAVANYAQYTGGSGKATASLSPVTIGFVDMQSGPTSESDPEATLAAQAAVKMINTVLGGVHGNPVQLSTCYIQDSDCPGDNLRRAVHQQQGHQGHRRRHQSIGNAAMCSVLNGPIPVVLGVSASPADDTAKNVFEVFPAAARCDLVLAVTDPSRPG